MIIRCSRCRAEITGEYRFRVEDGHAFCVTHTEEKQDDRLLDDSERDGDASVRHEGERIPKRRDNIPRV